MGEKLLPKAFTKPLAISQPAPMHQFIGLSLMTPLRLGREPFEYLIFQIELSNGAITSLAIH
jgi:hypothetical protein